MKRTPAEFSHHMSQKSVSKGPPKSQCFLDVTVPKTLVFRFQTKNTLGYNDVQCTCSISPKSTGFPFEKVVQALEASKKEDQLRQKLKKTKQDSLLV